MYIYGSQGGGESVLQRVVPITSPSDAVRKRKGLQRFLEEIKPKRTRIINVAPCFGNLKPRWFPSRGYIKLR